MTFDEWLNRPVYKAQVHTFTVAREMFGCPIGDLVTNAAHPLVHFRALPSQRTEYGKRIRKIVAEKVRESRRDGTYKLNKVAP